MGNADLVLRFYNEVANEGHVEVLDEILTGDFVLNGRLGQPAPPGPPRYGRASRRSAPRSAACISTSRTSSARATG